MDNSGPENIVPVPLPPEFQPTYCCKWDDWTEKFNGSVGKLTSELKAGTVCLPKEGVIVFSKRKERFYLFTPEQAQKKTSGTGIDVQVAELRAKKNAAMQSGNTELVQTYKNRITDLLIGQLQEIKEAAIQADDLEKAVAIKRQILALNKAGGPNSTSSVPRECISQFFTARAQKSKNGATANVVNENQHVMKQLDILFSDLSSPADATKAWIFEASRLFAKIFAMHCSLKVLVRVTPSHIYLLMQTHLQAADGKKITNSIPKTKNHKACHALGHQ